MTTLAQKCKDAGLESAAELTRITGTSKETLTNWMKDKPSLFETVLKGALASKAPTANQEQFVKSSEDGISYIDYLYLKNDYDALKEKHEKLKKEKKQPEQTWAFSQEDMQEQAKLIEKLTTENLTLSAELQIAKKSSMPGKDDQDLLTMLNKLKKQKTQDDRNLKQLKKDNELLKSKYEGGLDDVIRLQDEVAKMKALLSTHE